MSWPPRSSRPVGCAGRRFKPIGRGFGSVSLQAAPYQVRSTDEVQVRRRMRLGDRIIADLRALFTLQR
jgi:hypothetical protein